MIRRFLLPALLWLLAFGAPASAQPLGQFIQGAAGGAQGPCANLTSDAWSPSYFFGAGGANPYIALSNFNLTSTVATDGVNKQTIEIGSLPHGPGSGKFYEEYTVITVGGSDLAFGLALCTHDNQTSLGFSPLPHAADSVGYQFFSTSQRWAYNDAFGPIVGLPLPSDGDVIGIAEDMTAGGICIRNVTVAPTIWYGNTIACDPVAGTNMFPFTAIGSMYLAWASNGNGVTHEGGTMNAHGPFAAAAPTGYGPWQP